MDRTEEHWLDPSRVSPRVRAILREQFFWDFCDENSPLGNDTGADAGEYYYDWLNKQPG
jgi:uncharacterized protein YfeS